MLHTLLGGVAGLARQRDDVPPKAARWLHRAAVIMAALQAPAVAARLRQFPDDYVGPWGWIWFAAYAVLIGIALWQTRPGATARWAMRLGLLLGLIHPLTMPWIGAPAAHFRSQADPYPAIFAFGGLFMFVAPAVLRTAGAAVYLGLWLLCTTPFFLEAGGVQAAVLRQIHMSLIGGTCIALGVAVHGTLRRTRADQERTLKLLDTEWAEHLTLRAKAHWEGLVHDKVIAALDLTGRAGAGPPPGGAAELARDALHLLDQVTPTQTHDMVRDWTACAERHGLTASVRLTGSVSDHFVVESLLNAGYEAIANVAEHSGAGHVEITAELADTHGTVIVQDRGQGFDQATTAPGHGISLSLKARMERAGGSATIQSAPGDGTVVTLRYGGNEPESPHVTWNMRMFIPMIVVGYAMSTFSWAMGWPHWWQHSPHPIANLALGVALLVLLTWSLLMPLRSAQGHAVGVLVTVALGAAPLLAGPDDGSWMRYWYVSEISLIGIVLALRFSRVWAAVYAVSQVLAAALGNAVLGVGALGVVIQTGPMHLGAAAAGVGLSLGMRRATRFVAEQLEAQSMITRRIAQRHHETRELRRRSFALQDLVRPMLLRIAAQESLSAHDVADCLNLASAARYELTCPLLLHADTRAALLDAERRGVHVTLNVEGVDGWQSLREFTIRVLQQAQRDDHVTLTGGVDISGNGTDHRSWSVVYLSERAVDLTDTARQFQQNHPAATVYIDDECLYVCVEGSDSEPSTHTS